MKRRRRRRARPNRSSWRGERALLHEVLRLVAERAAAEPRSNANGARNDTAADAEYQRTRQCPRSKSLTRKRPKIKPATSNGGERSSTPRCGARPRPKPSSPPPAARSPRCSTRARHRQERLQPRQERRRRRVRLRPEEGRPRARREEQADQRQCRAGRLVPPAAGFIVAADYRKFGLDPEPPAPTADSYDKYD